MSESGPTLSERSLLISTASRTQGRRSHALMHAMMLFATFCWAANIIAGKIVLRSMGPLALAQLRTGAGAVLFCALFLSWRGRPALHLTLREWGFMGQAALFGITLNQLCFITGIGRTSAAHASLIVALGPVMVLILACVMRLEALTLLKMVGTLVSLAGVIILTASKATPGSGATLAGDLIMLAGTTSFAYYTILLKEVAERYDALTLNTIVFAIGAVLMLPFGTGPILDVHWRALPVETWWCAAFIVVLGTVLAYLIFAFVLAELTAARVAAFNYLQPVVAISLGVWLLAERLTLRVVVGGVLILLGVYLTEREGKEEDTVRA